MLKIIRECLRRTFEKSELRRACRTWALLGMCVGTSASAISAAQDAASESLQSAYVRMGRELRSTSFGRQIVMRSVEGSGSIQGDVYAVINFPLDQLNDAVATPAHWCDVMILHVNTKYCHVAESVDGPTLTVRIGKNSPQKLSETTRLDFKFKAQVFDPANLKVVLTAMQGPIGTSNYRIILEAVAIEGVTSFLHLSYSYDFNALSRAALSIYLSTLGRNKVGFTLANTATTAAPVYIQGMRALVERNTMRYFLAISAYLESAHRPEEVRLDARLLDWFTATESYPLQLQEIEWKDYLSMKHAEVLRQQELLQQ